VAEIRPIVNELNQEERIRELRAKGILGPPGKHKGELAPIAHRPGALARFLEERD
jgi:hypothetical protein